jgi:predicted dehydrogenase
MVIRVALLGAGHFIQDGMNSYSKPLKDMLLNDLHTEHLPAVKSCSKMSLKAIFSRSESSAVALASLEGVDAYWSSPIAPSRSLEALLARDDIDAVIIALPIMIQPDVIRQAIEAGKHVLSEKPIASNVDDALSLMVWYHAADRKEVWSVGENFRFMDTMVLAANNLRALNGRLLSFSLSFYHMMREDDKFYNTDWYVSQSGNCLSDLKSIVSVDNV